MRSTEALQTKTREVWLCLKGVDGVIGAARDCGSRTKFLIYNTMFAEDHGKPTVPT